MMSNILKAAKLDFALMKQYTKSILFTIAFPIFFTLLNRSMIFGISFAMCYSSATSSYTFSICEANNMERFYGILPIKRSEFVLGRYLLIILQGVLTITVSIILQLLALQIVGENVQMHQITSAFLTGIFLYSTYTAFLIPGFYKYGSIKGRVFLFFTTLGFLATLFILPKLSFKIPAVSIALNSQAVLFAVVFVSIVIMYFISMCISVRITEHKEI